MLKTLTLFRRGFSGAAQRLGGGAGGCKKKLLLKICDTYPTMLKFGTVITYLQKIQKIYDSRDTALDFC